MDDESYDLQVSESDSVGSFGSWPDIDDLLEGLEQSRRGEKERVEDEIEEIEGELARVEQVYEENADDLLEKIRGQKNRLDSAESSAGVDVVEVRDRLASLYRELRRERREDLQDRRSLLLRKWELERELRELKNIDSLFVSDK